MNGELSMPSWRKALSRIATILVSSFFIFGAIALVVLGRDALAARVADAPKPDPAELVAVRAIPIMHEAGYRIARRFVGQIEPAQQSDLSFELPGTIETILVDEGAKVAKGEVIAILDTRLLLAERDGLLAARDAVAAQAELARRTGERQTALLERGFASSQRVDETSLTLSQLVAETARINANIAAIDVRLEKATLRAPFDGEVTRRHRDDGTVQTAGQPVVSLLQDSLPQFRVGIAPSLLAQIRGQETLTVEVDDRAYPATLSAVLPGLDPATRTRTILLDLQTRDLPAFGDTGDLVLYDTISSAGAWVPVSALKDGTRGLWEVMTVVKSDTGSKIAPEAVEVLYANHEMAFVRGTFKDGAMVLDDGTHRVVPGQRVTLVTEAQ